MYHGGLGLATRREYTPAPIDWEKVLALRPPARRAGPILVTRRGVRGLGFDYSAITDCSMLTPYQQSQAPQCGGSVASVPTSSGYVAPTLAAPQSCIDAFGNPMFTPDCVNANLATQASNQLLLDAANRAVFLQNCHAMIAAENQSRAARGVPLQVDDCDSRTFGQVTNLVIPPPPAPAPAPAPVQAAVAAAVAPAPTVINAKPAVVTTSAPAPAASAPSSTAPASSSSSSSSSSAGYVGNTVQVVESSGFDVAGVHVPWWALAAAGAGVLLIAKR